MSPVPYSSPYGHQPPPPPPSPSPPPPPHYDPSPYVPVPPPSSPPSYPPSPTPSYYGSPPPSTPYYRSPPPPTPYVPTPYVPVPTPHYDPPPPPHNPYDSNSTGYTPPSSPGYWHGGRIALVVLVPIAGLCFLGLLAGFFLFARRRRRVPEPECPPEEPECPQEEAEVVYSEHVRVQEQAVAGPAGEVVVVDVLDEVVVQQEHGGVVGHAHGRGKGPY